MNRRRPETECRLALAAALLGLLALAAGCSGDGGALVDAGRFDGGRRDLLPGGDAHRDGGDELEAIVASIVKPYVDPTGALNDSSKTVGVVVAVVGVGASGVFGFGATRAGGAVAPDGNTIFQIGSISKALTGLVLAREVTGASGLKRSDLADSYLPGLKGSNGTTGVTLGMLAAHHSGLGAMPGNLTDRDLDGKPDPTSDPLSPGKGYAMSHLKTYLFGLASPVAAGKAYKYSNTGIGLLGLALQAHLTTTDYHALLQKTLLKDLQITDLWGEVTKMSSGLTGRIAQGHATQAGKRTPGYFSQMGVLSSAGETITTGNAMQTLLEAFTGQRKTPLDAAIAEWLKPIKPATGGDLIAYGIEVSPDAAGSGATYMKSGSTVGGYSAHVAFRRDPRVGVAVLTNVASYSKVKTMALEILDRLRATP